MEADIIRSGANEVTASPASDWLRDISGSHFQNSRCRTSNQ